MQHTREFHATRFLAGLLTVVVALGVAACSVTPSHEFDPEADFSQYDMWRWQAPDYGNGKVSDPILDSPLLGQRVEDAVAIALGARGFTRNEATADFIVTYHTSKDIDLYDSGPGFSVGLHQGWSHFHTGIIYDNRTSLSKQGVLIIDILDAGTDQLVWRGWRALPLRQQSFDAEHVTRAVKEILSAFPPERSAAR